MLPKLSTCTLLSVPLPFAIYVFLLRLYQGTLQKLHKAMEEEYGEFDVITQAVYTKLEPINTVFRFMDVVMIDEFEDLDPSQLSDPEICVALHDLIDQYFGEMAQDCVRPDFFSEFLLELCIGHGITSDDLYARRTGKIEIYFDQSEKTEASRDELGECINLTGDELDKLLMDLAAKGVITRFGDHYAYPKRPSPDAQT